jgi:hypothetical protein
MHEISLPKRVSSSPFLDSSLFFSFQTLVLVFFFNFFFKKFIYFNSKFKNSKIHFNAKFVCGCQVHTYDVVAKLEGQPAKGLDSLSLG